jgi:hypothetical protein
MYGMMTFRYNFFTFPYFAKAIMTFDDCIRIERISSHVPVIEIFGFEPYLRDEDLQAKKK